MISEAWRKSGSSLSLNGSTGSSMENLTTVGMRSGLLHQVATRKLDKSVPDSDLGEESKMKHEDEALEEGTDLVFPPLED
jgi:hypothetical protein